MSNKVRSNDAVGFSLSFLDVLSCGLGAAILLLLVVKHGTTDVPIDTEAYVATQTTRIQQELDDLLERKSHLDEKLQDAVQGIEQAVGAKAALAQSQDQTIKELRSQLAALSAAQAELQSANDELKELQAVPTEQPEPQTGSTGHLGGLAIAQSRVVILLDKSASMLDRSLVEIVRLRVADSNTKLAAEKWSTARKTAEWVYKQVQDQGQFQLLSFSNSVTDIANNVIDPTQTTNWLEKGAKGIKLSDIRSTLAGLQADGPTNLELAFEAISSLRPRPNQVVLITDGLPTVPEGIALGRIRGCPTPRGTSTPILSPRCRKGIFDRAVAKFYRTFRSTEMHVVLLPLDGDAQAMFAYWNLAATTGGRVLTPAKGWPW